MTQRPTETDEKSSRRRARQRQRSRYTRPRTTIIWTVLLIGVMVGMGAGLYYAWEIQPLPEEEGVAPWQLESREDTRVILPDRDAYMMAALLAFQFDNDLATAISRLIDLRLPGDDEFQYIADTACRLVTDGYVGSNNSRRNALQAMVRFYQQRNFVSCADQLIMADSPRPTPIPTTDFAPTPTLVPPATKTPGPDLSPFPSATADRSSVTSPTLAPEREFELVVIEPFCSRSIPGVIEVRVRDFSGQGLPGLPIRARGETEESTFFTGLKPERGPGYADFDMTEGSAYIVEMPGLSDPTPNPLVAGECFDERFGETAIQSYRLVFVGE